MTTTTAPAGVPTRPRSRGDCPGQFWPAGRCFGLDFLEKNIVSYHTLYMSPDRPNPHDPPEWFSARRAAKLAGLTLPMLNYLCRNGVVEPTCNCRRGHGRARHYSFGDVVALRVVARLSTTGVQPLRLKNALRGLRRFHPEITAKSLPATHIVSNGRDVFLRQAGELLERTHDGQFAFAFVIGLAPIQRDVARKLGSGDMRKRRKAA
jgi:DNA-binding transcriptional MerR regulator